MSRHYILAIALCVALFSSFGTSKAPPAPECTDEIRENVCKLPTCRCSGTETPGDLPTKEIPQLVYLTFDDAVNSINFDFYQDMFFERKNPNGQPITITVFVTHEYTNYSMVHQLWTKGHEIALHSITHNSSTMHWAELSKEGWTDEIVQQREQMATFARIDPEDIKGMRAPFLQTSGDSMYEALQEGDFTWESSRPTLSFRKPALWPYTNDYQSIQDCEIEPCPAGEFKNFWTIPMIDMIGANNEGCAMADACTPVPNTEELAYQLLLKNFNDHYEGTRAPFGIFTHSAWLNGTGSPDIIQRRLGYIKFLDHLGTLNDVYIVSVSRALEWIKTPTTLGSVATFPAFQVVEKDNVCPVPVFACRFPEENTPFPSERYMYSCTTCPRYYPWVRNHLGKNPYTK